MLTFAVAVVSSLVSLAAAQMTIQVGAEATTSGGIFQFIPPTLNATKGSVVTFQFTGAPGNHSVTQSTLADPCDPMPGGFDSGWVLIPDANTLSGQTTPTFNITITDDSQPIWFFCKQLIPSPHCPVGMIGAINAPDSAFQTFTSNAGSFQGTPGQGQGGLVGQGASASALAGPIPSGATLFTGAPVSGSGSASATSGSGSGSGSGSATGSGTSAGGAASGTSTSAAGTSSSTSSDAIALSGSTFTVVLAALLGYIIA